MKRSRELQIARCMLYAACWMVAEMEMRQLLHKTHAHAATGTDRGGWQIGRDDYKAGELHPLCPSLSNLPVALSNLSVSCKAWPRSRTPTLVSVLSSARPALHLSAPAPPSSLPLFPRPLLLLLTPALHRPLLPYLPTCLLVLCFPSLRLIDYHFERDSISSPSPHGGFAGPVQDHRRHR